MINPNEAPEGFVAVEETRGCNGCAFDHDNPRCLTASCSSTNRTDKTNVIFIPREKSNLAESSELQKAKDEAAQWKAACLERDDLIAKLKAQLTTALDAIARMR